MPVGVVFVRPAVVPHPVAPPLLGRQHRVAHDHVSFPRLVRHQDRVGRVFLEGVIHPRQALLRGDEMIIHQQLPRTGQVAQSRRARRCRWPRQKRQQRQREQKPGDTARPAAPSLRPGAVPRRIHAATARQRGGRRPSRIAPAVSLRFGRAVPVRRKCSGRVAAHGGRVLHRGRRGKAAASNSRRTCPFSPSRRGGFALSFGSKAVQLGRARLGQPGEPISA